MDTTSTKVTRRGMLAAAGTLAAAPAVAAAPSSALAVLRGKRFANETVDLSRYEGVVDCHFDHCHLIYGGRSRLRIVAHSTFAFCTYD